MRPPTSSLGLIYLALDLSAPMAAEPPRGANSAMEEQAAIAAWFQKHDALPQDGKGMLIEQIGQAGSAADLRRLFAQAAAGGFTPEATVRALHALAAASTRSALPAPEATSGPNLSGQDRDAIVRLLASEHPEIQAAAARLAGAWKIEDALDRLSQLAGSKEPAVRQEAFLALANFGGETALRFFAVLVRP